MRVYREEIDGLRALALLPVILYHAGFTTFFAGGYVGVDIFFVISGYLITSIIQTECEEHTFSLISFYERRCRRIVPALFFILFISSAFAYHWMLPEQLLEFGQALISILTLSSNIFFWWKDDGYFTRLTELNPVVHTWSLAVEEQFYLIFPLLYYFLADKKRCLIILLTCFALVSFFLAQWGGNLQRISCGPFDMFSQHSYATFYLPLGRVWELLLGTFATLYLQSHVRKSFHQHAQFIAVFGLVLIIVSIVFFNNHRIPLFPNCYTLMPTCGATLIILFGDKNTLVGRLLSTRLLRWIGLISYSAYLWHQPMLAFIRLRSHDTPDILSIIIIISTIFPLSVLSYFFTEQPFRRVDRFSRRQLFCTVFLTTIIILFLALFLIQTAHNRSSSSINKESDSYLSDLKAYGNMDYVIKAFKNLAQKTKTFSNQGLTTNKRIALIGDSFSQDFYNIILEGKYLLNYEIRVYFVYTHCQIYIGTEDRQTFILAQEKQKCINANDIKYALPIIRQANIVVLASNWHEWSAQRLPTTLKLLNLTKQQQVYVLGAKHFGTFNLMSYVNRSIAYKTKQYQYPDPQFLKINRLLEQTIDKSIFVNIYKLICTGYNQTCPLFTPDGKLIPFDAVHLTKYGARYIGNLIFKNKPFNRL